MGFLDPMYPTQPGVGSGTLYPVLSHHNRVSSFCLPLLLLTKTCGHARCSTLCPHIIEEIISNLAFLGVVVDFSDCPVKGSSFSTIKTCGHARCSTLCPHIIEEIIS